MNHLTKKDAALYLTSGEDSRRGRAVARHVKQCPDCADKLKKSEMLLSSMGPVPLDSDCILGYILRQAESAGERKIPQRFYQPVSRFRFSAALASLAVILFLSILSDQRRSVLESRTIVVNSEKKGAVQFRGFSGKEGDVLPEGGEIETGPEGRAALRLTGGIDLFLGRDTYVGINSIYSKRGEPGIILYNGAILVRHDPSMISGYSVRAGRAALYPGAREFAVWMKDGVTAVLVFSGSMDVKIDRKDSMILLSGGKALSAGRTIKVRQMDGSDRLVKKKILGYGTASYSGSRFLHGEAPDHNSENENSSESLRIKRRERALERREWMKGRSGIENGRRSSR